MVAVYSEGTVFPVGTAVYPLGESIPWGIDLVGFSIPWGSPGVSHIIKISLNSKVPVIGIGIHFSYS